MADDNFSDRRSSIEEEKLDDRFVVGFGTTLIGITDPLTDADIKWLDKLWRKPFIYEEQDDPA